MRIVLVSFANPEDFKVVGDSSCNPIPREGESVNLAYNPFLKVLKITYDYDNQVVAVVVDGIVNI